MNAETKPAPGANPIIERLSREHSPALLRWARGRLGDGRDAEEVVADTLVRAWRHFDQFDPARGSERSWLFGIAHNAAIDHYRKGARHLRSVSVAEPASMADRTDADNLDIDIDRLVESSHVRDALATLSDDHRVVVVDAYYRGLSTRQIGDRHSIPTGTVKSRLYYALKVMRSRLEEQGVLQ